ncbi:MAG TPA: formimidoylglutamate deiminase [Pyrinomonadaceae bacterium]|nr:formimidoylglutamate deiminase [Pyrinomonadaceae bacterium]
MRALSLNQPNPTIWQPDLIYADRAFLRDREIACNDAGEIVSIEGVNRVENRIPIKNRAALPGLVNAHSHAFQRVIRGRTEYRTANSKDSFWTWREMMYRAAMRLTPEDIYDASRMAFLEMALSGITSVGEFHYLHHGPNGSQYDDPNLLAKEVVRAAQDVGLRIALLRVAYARSGFETETNPRQARFIEDDPDVYLQNVEQLSADLKRGSSPTVGEGVSIRDSALPHGRATAPAWVGLAPHSVRAVSLDYLKAIVPFGNEQGMPIHMHVAEQPAEVSACIQEYGRSPIALLETEGLLSDRFTAVHAIHVTPKAIATIARARAMVCACPTTERNLGDGVFPADRYFQNGVRVALGTDSHVEINLMEDARELEYNLRLQKIERVVLDVVEDSTTTEQRFDGASALAARLFECATVHGAASINSPGGVLETGHAADFFTIDLDDPSLAGATEDDLLASVVFSLSRTAIKDVVVGGRRIVEDGRHAQQEDIVQKFQSLQKKLWR